MDSLGTMAIFKFLLSSVTPGCILTYKNTHIWDTEIRQNIQLLSFGVWFTLLGIIFSSSIHLLNIHDFSLK